MDLASLNTTAACDKGTEIELVHPVTKAPLGIFWGIVGRDSTIFQEHVRQQIDEDMRRAAMAKKRGKEPELLTTAKREARGLSLLVACSTGWRTVEKDSEKKTLTFEGRELEFTETNAATVLEKLSWIREQIDEGIADLENFMKV
jgi:hypothetical protein